MKSNTCIGFDFWQKLNEEVDYLKVKNERLEKHRTECLEFEEKITDLVNIVKQMIVK